MSGCDTDGCGGGNHEHDTPHAEPDFPAKRDSGAPQRYAESGIAARDPVEWRTFVEIAFSDTTFDDGDDLQAAWGAVEIAEIADELALCLAAVREAVAGGWKFVLDLGRLGEIDGRVSLEADMVHIELRPHDARLSRFLIRHRRELEQRASNETRIEIAVTIK